MKKPTKNPHARGECDRGEHPEGPTQGHRSANFLRMGGPLPRPATARPIQDLPYPSSGRGLRRLVETDIDRGEFLDPKLGKKTLGDWAQEWLEARDREIKPRTHQTYEGLLPTSFRLSAAYP